MHIHTKHKGHFIFKLCFKFSLMVKVFANGPRDRGSIPGLVLSKTQKMVLDASLLTFNIIIYQSRVSWAIQGKE